MRVVSLVPSVTETLLAWDVEPVACTRFCEQPSLRHVGGTKDPDVAAVLRLAPDLVVLNDEENRREDVEAVRAAGTTVHVVHVGAVADVAPAMAELRARLGLPPQTIELPPPSPATTRTAFVPIWRRPWMTLNGDTYGSSLLERCGVVNVFAGAADRYPTIELADAAALRPDLVVVPTEPYAFSDRHVAELSEAAGAPAVLVDGKDLFWWGVRTPVAIERLRAQLARGAPPPTA